MATRCLLTASSTSKLVNSSCHRILISPIFPESKSSKPASHKNVKKRGWITKSWSYFPSYSEFKKNEENGINERANIAEAAARRDGPWTHKRTVKLRNFRFIFKKQIRNKMIHTGGGEVLPGCEKKCDCALFSLALQLAQFLFKLRPLFRASLDLFRTFKKTADWP